MTITIDKGSPVNCVDTLLPGFRQAEEALTRCTEILRAEGISGLDIAEALIQRVYAVLIPERTSDEAELRTWLEQGIGLMDDTMHGFDGIREILAKELDDF